MSPDPVLPGYPAPYFRAEDEQGRMISLEDFLGNRLVLFFYVRDGNEGCISQALSFRHHYQAIRDAGALVLGVSPGSSSSHADFKTEYGLPFTLLSDTDHIIADTYGCWGERRIMGKSVLGVIRSHFVIDETGLILDAQLAVGPSDSAVQALSVLTRVEEA
jgi:thioredoxin-dependent peroxiredoxin